MHLLLLRWAAYPAFLVLRRVYGTEVFRDDWSRTDPEHQRVLQEREKAREARHKAAEETKRERERRRAAKTAAREAALRAKAEPSLQAGEYARVSEQTRAEAVRELERRVEDLQRLLEHQDRSVRRRSSGWASSTSRAWTIAGSRGGSKRASAPQPADHRRPVDRRGGIRADLLGAVRPMGACARTDSAPSGCWSCRAAARGRGTATGGALRGRVRVLLARRVPRGDRGGQEAAARRRVRRGARRARHRGARSSGGPSCCIPGLMYRLFMPFWKELATIARVEQYTRLRARSPLADDPVLRELPDDYVAARFYFSDCFPDTPANRAFVSVDDRRHQPAGAGRAAQHAVRRRRSSRRSTRAAAACITVGAHMPPPRNLAVQTAVIARARAFVGTYGGYSYLAPFCGVPSLAFYSEPTFKLHHLHVAQHVFERLGGAVAGPAGRGGAAACVRLALSGALCVDGVMKVLFVLDSPEYLRFYDSVDRGAGGARPRRGDRGHQHQRQEAGRARGAAGVRRPRAGARPRPAARGHVGSDRARPARRHGFRPLPAPALRRRDDAARADQAEGAAGGVSLARRDPDACRRRACMRSNAR